jgi:hypothetical protein
MLQKLVEVCWRHANTDSLSPAHVAVPAASTVAAHVAMPATGTVTWRLDTEVCTELCLWITMHPGASTYQTYVYTIFTDMVY